MPFIFMTSTVSHGLGGTNILAVPSFLRVLFLTGCRVVGIKQFDTAKYYGASEATLASLNLRKIKVTSKWGVSLETDPKNPAAARWMGWSIELVTPATTPMKSFKTHHGAILS